MQNIVPPLLKNGDEIRVVMPSTGIKIIGQDCRQIAKERFEKLGLKVSFGANTVDDNFDMFGTSAAQKRAEDINKAFADKNVKAIFTVIGGFNSNQVLPLLDYGIIKQNPKIVCGFSDITALLNGIRAKTGLVTFYGPHYSSIGMLKGCEYTMDCLQKMLFNGSYDWLPAAEWSDDLWFINQNERVMITNEWWILRNGNAEGVLEGGNLGTLMLLNGTSYQPKFSNNTILAIEDCFTATATDAKYFFRQLQAMAEREDFVNVKALLIGRFQKGSQVSREKIEYMINNIDGLKNIPVIANVDFGHTTPIVTLPLGGYCKINNAQITLDIKAKK